jgi:hypothetical protein
MQMRALGGLSGGLAGDGGGVIQRLPRHSALLVRTDLSPDGACLVFAFTHGLRRGLNSYAASRLKADRFVLP